MFHKRLTPEEALLAITYALKEGISEEILKTNPEFNLSFNKDHSVDVYIIEQTKSPS